MIRFDTDHACTTEFLCQSELFEQNQTGNQNTDGDEGQRRTDHEPAAAGLQDDEPEARLADIAVSRCRRQSGDNAGANERDPEHRLDISVNQKDGSDGEDTGEAGQGHGPLHMVALEGVLPTPQFSRLRASRLHAHPRLSPAA